MTKSANEERQLRRSRHETILAEVAQKEDEAAVAEIVEKARVLDVPLHLRIIVGIAMAVDDRMPCKGGRRARRGLRDAVFLSCVAGDGADLARVPVPIGGHGRAFRRTPAEAIKP